MPIKQYVKNNDGTFDLKFQYYTVTESDNKYVTLSTDQIITGIKTFDASAIYLNQIKSAPFLGTDSSGKVQKVTPKTLTFTSGDTTTTYNGTAAVTVDLVTIVDLTGGL